MSKKLILMFTFVIITIAMKAQTNASNDSAFTVTDTSVTTPNNIVVTDSGGNTTFFAGGEQSGYNGNVGVGTDQPTNKLTIYDDQHASFCITQRFEPNSNSPERLSNFSIDFIDDTNNSFLRHTGGVRFVAFGGTELLPGVIHIPDNFPLPTGEIACFQTLDPDMSFQAKSFGWYTANLDGMGCPNGDYTLQMQLWGNGDLSLNQNLTVNQNVNVNHNAIIHHDFGVDHDALIGHELTVNGNFMVADDFKVNTADHMVYARGIHCTVTTFPDYVFENSYSLMNLHDLEIFINNNHHLPGLPTAKDAEANVVNIAEMQTTLLQKIEELTLYVIHQQKEIDELKAQQK